MIINLLTYYCLFLYHSRHYNYICNLLYFTTYNISQEMPKSQADLVFMLGYISIPYIHQTPYDTILTFVKLMVMIIHPYIFSIVFITSWISVFTCGIIFLLAYLGFSFFLSLPSFLSPSFRSPSSLLLLSCEESAGKNFSIGPSPPTLRQVCLLYFRLAIYS